MTNVLIPTDFTLQSLELITAATQLITGRLNVLLFHAFDMPDSLMDAMHRNGVRSHSSLITEEIRVRSRQIKAAHPEIANIRFLIMYGSSVAVFKDFAAANEVDLIIYPAAYRYFPVVRESIDPDRMFLKSRLPIIRKLAARPVSANLRPELSANGPDRSLLENLCLS
jgi:hypothetical protein